MTDVLFGRNLRLKVAITLWQRNVDELLTYLLRYVVFSWFKTCDTQHSDFQKCYITVLYRIRDTGVFVDFLPLISKR